MRVSRTRPFAAFTAIAAIATLVLAACGGGGDDDASFEGETVESSDGVLSVQIAGGAAPDGVEVEIAVLEDGDLPSELRDLDAVVMGYELSPDGAEFSEPVTVTFRLDAGDLGFDLPDGAVPLGLLLTENAAGDLESLGGAELSREGDQIVAQVAVTHFSPAILVLSSNTALVLTPPEVEMEVGETRTVTVIGRDLNTGESGALESIGLDGRRALWGVMDPFTFELLGPTASATERYGIALSCTAKTDGWVTAAYDVIVDAGEIGRLIDRGSRGALLAIFGKLDIFGQGSQIAGMKLAGDGKCNAAEETPTPAGSSTDGGGSSSVEVRGANAAGQLSGDVAGAVGGCEDGESKPAECVPRIDITGVSWGPVEGSPNLMEVGVTLGGTPPADSSADYIVSVGGIERGSGTPIVQEQIRALRGQLSCESFRGGLPGEACVTPAPDQFLITVDVSELMPPLRIELSSIQGTTAGRVGDHYVVENIGE